MVRRARDLAAQDRRVQRAALRSGVGVKHKIDDPGASRLPGLPIIVRKTQLVSGSERGEGGIVALQIPVPNPETRLQTATLMKDGPLRLAGSQPSIVRVAVGAADSDVAAVGTQISIVRTTKKAYHRECKIK